MHKRYYKSQLGTLVHLIKDGYNYKQLYKFELENGWTGCTTLQNYKNSLKQRLTSFLKINNDYWTIEFKIKYKQFYNYKDLNNMSSNKSNQSNRENNSNSSNNTNNSKPNFKDIDISKLLNKEIDFSLYEGMSVKEYGTIIDTLVTVLDAYDLLDEMRDKFKQDKQEIKEETNSANNSIPEIKNSSESSQTDSKENKDEISPKRESHFEVSRRCSLVDILIKRLKIQGVKTNKTKMCKIMRVSRRTLNHKQANNFKSRKIRKDAKVIDQDIINHAITYQKMNKGCVGHRKITININSNEGYQCSPSTTLKILKREGLYCNSVKITKANFESKDTKFIGTFLLENDQIEKLGPNQAFSIDFSQIETNEGVKWMHGATDVVTRKVLFLRIVDNQKIETVLEDYKKLPKTTKIVNTDYGSSYMSKKVQDYLKKRDIKQSVGEVGDSWYNRWIEDFWKRVKYEW